MPEVPLQAGPAANGSGIMKIGRFVVSRVRRIGARLKALIDRIDLSNFPGSCCG
jgi:hypothetical protein